jgi:hypothetical protein
VSRFRFRFCDISSIEYRGFGSGVYFGMLSGMTIDMHFVLFRFVSLFFFTGVLAVGTDGSIGE